MDKSRRHFEVYNSLHIKRKKNFELELLRQTSKRSRMLDLCGSYHLSKLLRVRASCYSILHPFHSISLLRFYTEIKKVIK